MAETLDTATVESRAAVRADMVESLRKHGLDPSDWMDVYDALGEMEETVMTGKASDAESVTSFVEMAEELDDDYDYLDPEQNPSVNSPPLPGTEHHQSIR